MTRSQSKWWLLPIASALTTAAVADIEHSGFASDFNGEPIGYDLGTSNDAVAQLQRRMDAGEVRLERDDRHGYLRSVLRELNVVTSSQVLVFAKTSLQLRNISPHRPRAIYFNDRTYVGWVQFGEVIEIASVDPQRGPIQLPGPLKGHLYPSPVRHSHRRR